MTDTIDGWVDAAARSLSDLFDADRVRRAWRLLRDVPPATTPPCWVHTDLSVENVLVHPDARRKGLGGDLVREAFAPFSAVRQHVLITDEEAGQKAFYESLGFAQLGDPAPGRAFVRFTA